MLYIKAAQSQILMDICLMLVLTATTKRNTAVRAPPLAVRAKRVCYINKNKIQALDASTHHSYMQYKCIFDFERMIELLFSSL